MVGRFGVGIEIEMEMEIRGAPPFSQLSCPVRIASLRASLQQGMYGEYSTSTPYSDK